MRSHKISKLWRIGRERSQWYHVSYDDDEGYPRSGEVLVTSWKGADGDWCATIVSPHVAPLQRVVKAETRKWAVGEALMVYQNWSRGTLDK